MEFSHIPVLLQPCLDGLAIDPAGSVTVQDAGALRATLIDRLVATAVTAEAEALLHAHRDVYGGQILRLGVEHLRPLGRYSGWEPTRNLVIYFCDKPEQPNAGESALQEGGPEAT